MLQSAEGGCATIGEENCACPLNRRSRNRRPVVDFCSARLRPWQPQACCARQGTTSLCAAEEKGTKHAIRLGGPVFGAPQDPEGLALAHRKLHYRAAYCPAISLNDKERIRDTAAAFAKHDVILAEVGRWCNLTDSDAAQRTGEPPRGDRRPGIGRGGRRHAAAWILPARSARRSGTARIPTTSRRGSSTPPWRTARKIIDAVKPKRAKFCYEMMGWSLPDSPDAYLKMIKAVDREAFAVHLDVCNLINCRPASTATRIC